MLVETDHDINMMSRWLESLSRVDDLPSQLIDAAVKKKKHTARFETINISKEIFAAMIELEKSGIKNTDWMFERDKEGNITGNYISEVDSTLFYEA